MAIINGTGINDVLIGTPAADLIRGFGGNDVLIGLGGIDVLQGGAGIDVLIAGDGSDLLDGGTGADIMFGGLGNDTYIVDTGGDVVAEAFNEGIDTILASVSQNLNAAGKVNVENLTLTGLANINGLGNALNNIINGNGGDNTLFGFAGNDTINGFGGDDFIFGGDGNDVMNGGVGADDMTGGDGNDIYFIDNVADVVDESGTGIDLLVSSITTTLSVVGRLDIENLALTGVANINGAGNALNNVITGNAGNNVLRGFAGNDVINGNAGNDTLIGGDDNDVLNGGLGVDTILTGADTDTIVFNSALGVANADNIIDYSVANDTIFLENAVFVGLANGALAAAAFRNGPVALDADDRIIYDGAGTGGLFFDADGNGAGLQVQFADLASGLPITAADFFVI